MKIFSNTLIYNQLFNFVAQNSGKLQKIISLKSSWIDDREMKLDNLR